MIGRIVGLVAVLGAALVLSACLSTTAYATEPYYAVAISSTRLYALTAGDGGSGGAVSTVYEFTADSNVSLSDVSAYGNIVFVTDETNNKLHILQLNDLSGTPSATLLSSKTLENGGDFYQPSSLAVSPNGASAYVVGETRSFAHVTGDWSDPQVQIYPLSDQPVDVATYGPGDNGVVGGYNSAFGAKTTSVSKFFGGSANAGDAFSPQAIAAASGYAYVVNTFGDIDPKTTGGSLSVVNAQTSSFLQSYLLPDKFLPQDIVTFGLDSKQYLAIVGSGDFLGPPDVQQVLKIELDGSGLPIMGGLDRYPLDNEDYSTGHYLAASDDGERVWISNSAAQTVTVLDTSTWDKIWGTDHQITESIRQITTCVPEPSGLAALCVFGTGALTMIRRRGRRPRRS